MAIGLGCGYQGTEQYIGLAFRRRSERSRRCTGGGCRPTIFFLLPLPVGLVGHYPERGQAADLEQRSEEHTSELQSLMRISYAVFCLKKKKCKSDLIGITQTST